MKMGTQEEETQEMCVLETPEIYLKEEETRVVIEQ